MALRRGPITAGVAVAVAAACVLWAGAPGPGAAAGGVLVVPLSRALSQTVPIEIGAGRVALLDVAPHHVTVVATSDPSVAHPVIRDTGVLLVARTPGVTTVGVGLGGDAVVSFRVTVTETDPGLRAVRLEQAADPQPAPPQPPSRAVSAASPPQKGASAARPAPAVTGAGGPSARPEPAGSVQAFIAGLTDTQRGALAAYLGRPSLASLAALLRTLTPPQQAAFLKLVAESPEAVTASMPAPGSAVGTGQGAPASPAPRAPAAGDGSVRVNDGGVRVVSPAGIRVAVVPSWAGRSLAIGYIVQNMTAGPVRVDPKAVTVRGAVGDVTVRQLDAGEPGVLAPGAAESGMIALVAGASDDVVIEWSLGGPGGPAGAIRITVPVRRSAAQQAP
jgi:hypothetical protein